MSNKLISFLLCYLCLSVGALHAQNKSQITVDDSAFNLVTDSLVRNELLSALDGFLTEKNNGSQGNSYIDSTYLKQDIEPFQHIQNIEFFDGEHFFYPTLLRVMPLEGNDLLLKIAYMGTEQRTKKPILRMLFSLIAKKGQGRYYFYNPLEHYTRKWNKTKVGHILYTHANKLNFKEAKAMDKFNTWMARKLEMPVMDVKYYLFEDPEQLFKGMGYDFIENMYYSRTGGLAMYWNNTLFAGKNSARYDHELVHFYTYRLFTNGTRIVHEGYATYLGGSGGKTLDELLPSVKQYIANHPDEKITDMATDYYNRIPDVPFTYVLSALVCRDVEQRFGMEGIKKLFNPKKDEDHFVHLKTVIGIDEAAFPDYIKGLLGIK